MGWLLPSVVACMLAVVTTNDLHCQPSTTNTCTKNHNGRFYLDGHQVTIKQKEDRFILDCGGWEALDFPTLPSLSEEKYVNTVKISNCPLPTSRSLGEILTAFNVKLSETGNGTLFKIFNLPSSPQLTENHLIGLENVTGLKIEAKARLLISADLLSGFQSLRSLELTRLSLKTGNGSLDRSFKAMLILPDPLEKLVLTGWKQKRLPPFVLCENLRQVELYNPNLETLPPDWIAGCPKLEKILIKSAPKLEFLPSGLLNGADALKRLTFTRCTGIQWLPSSWLRPAPNLVSLDLSHNRVIGLNSEMFLGPALRSLSLASNRLTGHDLSALASLTTLHKLDLSDNEDFKEICDENGNSPLQHLTELKELSFYQTDVKHVCRDWREKMTQLRYLDLGSTEIAELTYADLKFTRSLSNVTAEVSFDSGAITSVTFTEDDYTRALNNPTETAAPVEVSWGFDDLICNCKMYWTRKAIDIPNFKTVFPLDQLKCNDGKYLKYKTLDEVCPEREKP